MTGTMSDGPAFLRLVRDVQCSVCAMAYGRSARGRLGTDLGAGGRSATFDVAQTRARVRQTMTG